jgi:dTDP-4-amino-4,6-dideoxygalactose transaminase
MSKNYQYNPWPLGRLNAELRRAEPDLARKLGYEWEDPRNLVDMFEEEIAIFTGSKYAVAVDCASHGIFLALKYLKFTGEVSIPRHTYASVPMEVVNAGATYKFIDDYWLGEYSLSPTKIIDSAGRFKRGMYLGNDHIQILSFQIKKNLPIGRGGAILIDDPEAFKWLKLATYDGRDLSLPYDDPNHIQMHGWHYYMTPEDAARGLILLNATNEKDYRDFSWNLYPDLSKYSFYSGNYHG